MAMDMKAGTRLRSAVCSTEVVVIRPSGAAVDLRCGGAPMQPAGSQFSPGAPDSAHRDGTLLGKRYVDPATGLEVLCIKQGEGSLSLGSEPLPLKDATPLPSSD